MRITGVVECWVQSDSMIDVLVVPFIKYKLLQDYSKDNYKSIVLCSIISNESYLLSLGESHSTYMCMHAIKEIVI